MKQFIIFILVSLFLCVFAFNNYSNSNITQLVINLPELSKPLIKEKLEIEFAKLPGVMSFEISLMSNTLLIIYNDRKLDSIKINNIFQKWGCNPIEYSYLKLH
tara:strand:+ start:326 stop:634 length:309 start_codon:yes stop_codon:yes gene_type:complete